ncbi:MAG TPA: transaldolase [Anaerolineae bacterium]|nr:transaldolase [Anaerolineae bacterium]
MTTNRVQELSRLGQSVWYDNISRQLLGSGGLRRLIAAGLLGMTSNPTIFEKAMRDSREYDTALRRLIKSGAQGDEIYEALTIEDVGAAADEFRRVYEQTGGGDGYVSIEVSPTLAHDAAGTLAEARRLWQTLNRPNIMVKVPATRPGLGAIEQLLSEGLNINITLMFSMTHYEAVAEAHIRGLETRAAAGQPIDRVASVASFFVSRVDTLVDTLLEAIVRQEGPDAGMAASLLGKAAVANSKLVYERFRQIYDGQRFAALKARGARLQRVLWASTSAKNPNYPDTLYVDTLIGPDTVNTVPPETYTAIQDHAFVRRTVDQDLDAARKVVSDLARLGIDLNEVGERLSVEGVEKFAQSYEQALGAIAVKRAELMAARPAPGKTAAAKTVTAKRKSAATKKTAMKKTATRKAAVKQTTRKAATKKKAAARRKK